MVPVTGVFLTSRSLRLQKILFPTGPATNYSLSFTAASLRPELARVIAEHYLACGDWELARERVLATNALQSKSTSSAIRLERELRRRLATLTHDQVALLAHAPAEDRAAVAWLAMIKYNRFVFEFAVEVLREKHTMHDLVLRHSDYEGFIETRLGAHPELARLTPASKTKIKNVLRRMLLEAGILSTGADLGTIQRPVISPALRSAITKDDPHWLTGFLVPDSEIALA